MDCLDLTFPKGKSDYYLNVLKKDLDIDPWVKLHSSVLYAFVGRNLLGIGDISPEFSGMGMIELVRYTITQMLALYGVQKHQPAVA